jgi:hypothetical protein
MATWGAIASMLAAGYRLDVRHEWSHVDGTDMYTGRVYALDGTLVGHEEHEAASDACYNALCNACGGYGPLDERDVQRARMGWPEGCEACNLPIDGPHYSADDCNETGRGVYLHLRCAERWGK